METKHKLSNHAKISYVKSAIRIIGFFVLLSNLPLGVLLLVGAEIVGIIEESFEK